MLYYIWKVDERNWLRYALNLTFPVFAMVCRKLHHAERDPDALRISLQYRTISTANCSGALIPKKAVVQSQGIAC